MKTSIDTMIVQSNLTKEQMDCIFDYIHNGYYQNETYRYNLHIKEYGFTIHLLPVNPLWKFNAKIKLQTNFFNQKYIPHSLIEILHLFDWSITSLHVAYDFHTDYTDSVSVIHHGNIKTKHLTDNNGHSSNYTGAFNPKRKNNQSIHYDRNEKEISLNYESGGFNHVLSNRYEVRLSFKMDEQPLHEINHQSIINQLKKYIFISSISDMETDGYTKRKFRKIAESPDKLNNDYKTERTKLRKIAEIHKEPLELFYEDAKNDNLFNFMKLKPHPTISNDYKALGHEDDFYFNQIIG